MVVWDYDSGIVTVGPKSKRTEEKYRSICQSAYDQLFPTNEPGTCLGPVSEHFMLVQENRFGVVVIDVESKKVIPTGARVFSEFLFDTAKLACAYYGKEIKHLADKSAWKDFALNQTEAQFLDDNYIFWSLDRRPRPI